MPGFTLWLKNNWINQEINSSIEHATNATPEAFLDIPENLGNLEKSRKSWKVYNLRNSGNFLEILKKGWKFWNYRQFTGFVCPILSSSFYIISRILIWKYCSWLCHNMLVIFLRENDTLKISETVTVMLFGYSWFPLGTIQCRSLRVSLCNQTCP